MNPLPIGLRALAAGLWVLCGPTAAHADTVSARCDIHPRGSDRPVKVVACRFSQRQGYVTIDRADGVRHELSPQPTAGSYRDERGREAIRRSGLGREGLIFQFAQESVHVYWDTAGLPAAPKPPSAEPTRNRLPPLAPAPTPFQQTLNLQGIGLRISSPNAGSTNELRIEPSGLEIDNTPIVRTIEGQVTGAELADLDADGSPEVYVYLRSTGAVPQGALLAYSANRRKSLSEIVLPPIHGDDRAARGYRGLDEFAVVENTLVRRFPVFKDGDPPSAPSGGVRQLRYRLKHGEATWRLVLERVDGF